MAPLRVGMVGAGIGGVAAAISLVQNGGKDIKVTILEAAAELGEIGAGIQMTPNVARLLIRWGVADVIGDNLVEFEDLNLRKKDGTIVATTQMKSRDWCGIPWWLVHRMHLHEGLVKVAVDSGVEVIIDARVTDIQYKNSKEVKVKTAGGLEKTFDILIGSDGINSIVRKTLLPHVEPTPPTGNAAYRAIVPMEELKKDPLTEPLTRKLAMDLWLGRKPGKQHGYIISYPISGGKDFNMVLSHHRDYQCSGVEDADFEEVKETYKDYDPRIRRVIEKISHPIKRWPLMVTICPTWSSEEKNVVLMGDAAHSMTNHMAQGAATSMEDGAFLGVALSYVAKGKIDVKTAVELYEKERMPLADLKQQVSYLNGLIYHIEDDSAEQRGRDQALQLEMQGKNWMKSPNLYVDPWTWRTVYEYDPELHADKAVLKHLGSESLRDPNSHVTMDQADIFLNWFLPHRKTNEFPPEKQQNEKAKL